MPTTPSEREGASSSKGRAGKQGNKVHRGQTCISRQRRSSSTKETCRSVPTSGFGGQTDQRHADHVGTPKSDSLPFGGQAGQRFRALWLARRSASPCLDAGRLFRRRTSRDRHLWSTCDVWAASRLQDELVQASRAWRSPRAPQQFPVLSKPLDPQPAAIRAVARPASHRAEACGAQEAEDDPPLPLALRGREDDEEVVGGAFEPPVTGVGLLDQGQAPLGPRVVLQACDLARDRLLAP